MFKKERRTAENEENLIETLGASLGELNKKDGFIAVPLVKIQPRTENARIGQKGLITAIPQIVKAIGELQLTSLLPYEEMNKLCATGGVELPVLRDSETVLFNTCAELANSFIESGGYADSPPKVFPMNSNGMHVLKFGHRRYIAYLLAQPITGVASIDTLVDRDTKFSEDKSVQSIARIKENAAREDNTVAELLIALKPIVEAALAESGKSPNKMKLSRETGIERTRLSRLIDMVEQGAADNETIMRKLHESKIEDVTALQMLFSQSPSQWDSLLTQLEAKGSQWFRQEFGSAQKNAPVHPPLQTETVSEVGGRLHRPEQNGTKSEAPMSRQTKPIFVVDDGDTGAQSKRGNAAEGKKARNVVREEVEYLGRERAAQYIVSLITAGDAGLKPYAVGETHCEQLESLLDNLSRRQADGF